MSVFPLGSRSASNGLILSLKVQTVLPAGSTSRTRPLPLSVISVFPLASRSASIGWRSPDLKLHTSLPLRSISVTECFAELVSKRGSPPDAVIAANDVMAIGCIDEAREVSGLDVPRDISIVGFDGVGPARYAAYNVTTVRQPVQRMTESAASMLLERIENPDLSPEKRAFSGIPVAGGSARIDPA